MTWLRMLLIMSFFISGCSVQKQQFAVPTEIQFLGNVFEIAADNQLDDMRQILYLPQNSSKNPDNWQQGFLIFLDGNKQERSLLARQQLRRQHFEKQPNVQASVAISAHELRSQVLYPPTERFQNFQLEVTRGQNFACGFGQMQFADKRSDFAKNPQQQTAYTRILEQLALHLRQLPWQMECK